MRTYRLSAAAQLDLREIKNYTCVIWGKTQMQKYLAELQSAMEQLAQTPDIGRIRNELEQDLRSFCVGRHVIFYREFDQNIDVARILHKSMDINSRFVAT
jgi:toxin ParE1/3/4